MKTCEACGKDSIHSISSIRVYDADGRYYIPSIENSNEDSTYQPRVMLLCCPCLRFLEDNFRASIAYLKSEKGLKYRREE